MCLQDSCQCFNLIMYSFPEPPRHASAVRPQPSWSRQVCMCVLMCVVSCRFLWICVCVSPCHQLSDRSCWMVQNCSSPAYLKVLNRPYTSQTHTCTHLASSPFPLFFQLCLLISHLLSSLHFLCFSFKSLAIMLSFFMLCLCQPLPPPSPPYVPLQPSSICFSSLSRPTIQGGIMYSFFLFLLLYRSLMWPPVSHELFHDFVLSHVGVSMTKTTDVV